MLPVAIIPSYPAPHYAALTRILEQLAGVAPRFQVDVVGRSFAGVESWPETEVDPLKELGQLRQWTDRFQFELDLMVSDPRPYLAALPALGIPEALVHLHDTLPVDEVVAVAQHHGCRMGIAATATTALAQVARLIERYGFTKVQLMGIAEVGKQGQSFDDRVLARIRELRAQFPEVTIAVDGAVNQTTIEQLYAAGANEFAPGSAVIAATDPVAAYKQLLHQVS